MGQSATSPTGEGKCRSPPCWSEVKLGHSCLKSVYCPRVGPMNEAAGAVAQRGMAVPYRVAVVSWNREVSESKLLVPMSPPPHRAHPSGGFVKGQTRRNSLSNLRERVKHLWKETHVTE